MNAPRRSSFYILFTFPALRSAALEPDRHLAICGDGFRPFEIGHVECMVQRALLFSNFYGIRRENYTVLKPSPN